MASIRGDFASLYGIEDIVKQIRAEREHQIRDEDFSPVYLDPEQKELLIFCLYVNVGIQSQSKAQERLKFMDRMMRTFANDIEEGSKYKVSYIIVPQKDAESRLECVFPKSQEEMDMSIFNKITEEKLLS